MFCILMKTLGILKILTVIFCCFDSILYNSYIQQYPKEIMSLCSKKKINEACSIMSNIHLNYVIVRRI